MKYRDELIAYDKEHGVQHNADIERAIRKQEYIHNHKDSVYKPEEVENVINFIESEFRQTKGQRENIKLQPTQKWWIEILFGYYDKEGHILINEIFINIIRGAGKSTLMAAIVITWMLLSDNFGGEGQVIAYDNKQAEEVYGQVLKQLQAGGDLIQFLSSNQKVKIDGRVVNIPAQLKTTRDGIVFKKNLNTFKKQTNDESTVQGGNTVLNIFDEVHTYKKIITEPVNMGSRKQSDWRSIYITSGGITRDGQYDTLIKQFTSDEDFYDIHTFAFIYRLDDASEVKDKQAWTKAAPMLGIIPRWNKVETEYRNAKDDPALQTRFLAYNMGIQTKDSMYYLTQNEAAQTKYDMNIWMGKDVYVGVDVSYSGDWSAVTFLMPNDDKWYVHTEIIATQDSIDDMTEDLKQKVEKFSDSYGFHVIDRDRIKAKDVFDAAANFIDEYQLYIVKLGYDRYNYDELHDMFDAYAYDADDERQIQIKQGFALSESINFMKRLLKTNRLIHNQPAMTFAMNNLAVRIGTSGDLMMKKFSYHEKIDPVAALIFAIEVSK